MRGVAHALQRADAGAWGWMTGDPDELVAWIAELRARVARGELDGRGHFAVGASMLDVAQAARIMLADLEHDKDLTLARRRHPSAVGRRRLLRAELRRLREQIG